MGKYLKGSGYTPIYVCSCYRRKGNDEYYEEGLNVIGAGLDFDSAMRYAEQRVEHMQSLGFSILDEGNDVSLGSKNEDTYYCVLNRDDEEYFVRVNKCPLMI